MISLSLYSTITVNGKMVIKVDVKATNGVIHFIDGVMLIPKGERRQLMKYQRRRKPRKPQK